MGHAFAIEPVEYTAFANGDEEMEKCREWGLLSEKAAKTKTYAYKRAGQSWTCNVVGFVDSITAVIQFENGQCHCIHPSYLKEMQAPGFGQRGTADNISEAAEPVAPAAQEASEPVPAERDEPAEEVKSAPEAASAPETASAPVKESPPAKDNPPAKEPAKDGKKRKLQLPEDKVKMTATVKEFAKVANHFTEEDDEVIIYEAVALLDPEMEVGLAWSSHSATLKKLELAVGDKLIFDAKIAAKKLLKHPVPYKINNPSKIQKE